MPKKKNKIIPLCEPNLSGKEKKYLLNCVHTNYVSTIGNYVEKFEKKVGNFLKSKYTVSCNSGTSALHLALRVVGVKSNHEVIVPSISFIATANAVKYLNANPIFMDCDDFLNIDIKKTLNFLSEKTLFKNNSCFNKKTGKIIKALIVVHVLGNAAYLDELIKVCKKKNIKIIEDSAAALGTRYIKGKYKNRYVGTIADIGCFSFNGNKIITCGSGGLLVTNYKKYFEQAKYLSTTACDRKLDYTHNALGYNYRLNNVNAAIGLAQIEKIKFYLQKKKKIFNFYKKNLKKNNKLDILIGPNYSENNNYISNIICKNNYIKKKIINLFKKNKVQVRSLWKPLHTQKYFRKYETYKITNALKYFNQTISIPSSSNIKITDLIKVVFLINNFTK